MPNRRNFPSPLTRSTKSYNDRLYKYLCSRASGEQFRRYKTRGLEPILSVADLSDWLYILALRKGRSEIDKASQRHDPPGISSEDLANLCERVAAFTVQTFDPEEIIRLGATRGRKSRRGPTYTLQHIRSVAGLSISKSAEALGCSPRTISNLRAKHKDDLVFDRLLNDDDVSGYSSGPGELPIDTLVDYTPHAEDLELDRLLAPFLDRDRAAYYPT